VLIWPRFGLASAAAQLGSPGDQGLPAAHHPHVGCVSHVRVYGRRHRGRPGPMQGRCDPRGMDLDGCVITVIWCCVGCVNNPAGSGAVSAERRDGEIPPRQNRLVEVQSRARYVIQRFANWLIVPIRRQTVYILLDCNPFGISIRIFWPFCHPIGSRIGHSKTPSSLCHQRQSFNQHY
jgi:hypothetical protein